MELIAKITRARCIAAAVLFLLLAACSTSPPEPIVIIHDPLVLQEIAPLPRTVVLARQAVTEFEPVYTTFRILEVSEENGVQKFFLARIGADRSGIQVGVTGEIAEDEAFQRIIGNYAIRELFPEFFRGEIRDLTHRIGHNAFARVKTGERLRGTASN